MKRSISSLFFCILVAFWSNKVDAQSLSGSGIQLTPMVSGFSRPVQVTHAGDRSGRLFVVEQGGKIRIIDGTSILGKSFLDISSAVSTGSEQGLLSVAFHPQFRKNKKFYIDYTDRKGDTIVAQYRVSKTNPNRADTASKKVLLKIKQPFANHNGGLLLFGADGFLYIGTGDGGSGGDPFRNGQRLDTLLGKILRIDVNHGVTYTVPRSNPFFGRSKAKKEIWAYGLRNPWRFSFDTLNGRLFAGDVGQNQFEEIDIVQRGKNYGWNIMEASHCFSPSTGCDKTGLEPPIAEYGRSEGQSVTGGHVYRGSLLPAIVGQYIFGDFVTGKLWSLAESNGSWTRTELIDTDLNISSFGENVNHELLVVDYSGTIYRMLPSS